MSIPNRPSVEIPQGARGQGRVKGLRCKRLLSKHGEVVLEDGPAAAVNHTGRDAVSELEGLLEGRGAVAGIVV